MLSSHPLTWLSALKGPTGSLSFSRQDSFDNFFDMQKNKLTINITYFGNHALDLQPTSIGNLLACQVPSEIFELFRLMIIVQNLSYTYPKASTFALKGLAFAIDAGEIFGFLGPSGAGKSTCQKILYKIISKYQGKIEIDGRDLAAWDSAFFEKIGVGFELPNHYGKLTAKENLDLFAAFYPPGRCQQRLELLELVGLGKDVNKQVASYSKGMKMRLNFVRAIMHDPDILFFDEPTSGMDPINAHIIKEHILRLKELGRTIFITTHDMATADELCDRVSFIVEGEIVLTESPAALKLRHGQNLVRVETESGQTKEFPLEKLGNNIDFHNLLKSGPVRRIQTLEASLEKVFIDVTGTSLK